MTHVIGVETTARFAVGRVIAQAISVFMRHPLVFTGLGILFAIPDIAYGIWYDQWFEVVRKDPPAVFSSMWTFVGIAAVLIGASIAIGIASYALTGANFLIGLFEDLRGHKVTFLQCLRRCAPALAQLLALSLLLGAASVPVFGLLIAIGILGWPILMYGLGAIAVVGMFVLFVNWWVVVPAIVEGYGALASFQRSLDLTRGHRWRIFALLLLPVLIAIACAIPLRLALDGTGLAYAIVDHGIDVARTLAQAMLSAVAYYHLRAEKEGFSVHDVAAVFD